MAIDWKRITKTHVEEACNSLAQTPVIERLRVGSIVVLHKDKNLPAKKVLRRAYEIAMGKQESQLRFSSGDGTVNLLRRFGLAVGRLKDDGTLES